MAEWAILQTFEWVDLQAFSAQPKPFTLTILLTDRQTLGKLTVHTDAEGQRARPANS